MIVLLNNRATADFHSSLISSSRSIAVRLSPFRIYNFIFIRIKLLCLLRRSLYFPWRKLQDYHGLRKPIFFSPMHSSAKESGVDGEPVEEIQQIHSGETEPVTIIAVVTTGGTTGPTSTDTATTSTSSTSTSTSVLDRGSTSTRYLVWWCGCDPNKDFIVQFHGQPHVVDESLWIFFPQLTHQCVILADLLLSGYPGLDQVSSIITGSQCLSLQMIINKQNVFFFFFHFQ